MCGTSSSVVVVGCEHLKLAGTLDSLWYWLPDLYVLILSDYQTETFEMLMKQNCKKHHTLVILPLYNNATQHY